MKKEHPFQMVQLSSFSEIDDFLRHLNKNRDYRHLYFRGQEDSEYLLVPSLFRKMNKRIGIPNREVIDIFKAEFSHVRRFIQDADELGTSLPPGYAKIKNIEYLTDEQVFNWWTSRENDLLEIIALAQHHGVKTRFLDFSLDSYVALYFAAESAFKLMMNMTAEQYERKHFSVWVLDWFFFSGRNINQELYKIQEYFAGFSSNHYLRAQKGIFISPVFENIPGYATYSWEMVDLKISIENCSKELARDSGGVMSIWPILFRLDIPYSKSPEVLMELGRRNYSLSTIKPNLDNIVQTWELSDKIRKEWSKFNNG